MISTVQLDYSVVEKSEGERFSEFEGCKSSYHSQTSHLKGLEVAWRISEKQMSRADFELRNRRLADRLCEVLRGMK